MSLFEDVSLTIARGERVGVLGVNGAGKSTMLRILAGTEAPDVGVVERRRDASVLYLAQEPELEAELSPRRIVEQGLAAWRDATHRHAEITLQIEREGPSEERLAEQTRLSEAVERLGGWTRGHVVDDMLGKLGVLDRDRPVGTMSGGERRRVALARLLVARPDLAILDEPTNHLDADTVAWLEEYLVEEHKGAVLLVTHDRYVLDAVCDRIVELDRGSLAEYQGGYGDYVEQKAERLVHEERVEQNRLNLVRREKAWLMRGAKARSTKQKARIKRAEAVIAAEPARIGPGVDLAGLGVSAPRTGRTILDLVDVTVSVGGRDLLRDLTLRLGTGERVGVVGPNGVGKTSLLRVITGELSPAQGEVTVGVQTRIALFDQARVDLVDDWTVLENVAEREGAHRTGPGVVTIGERVLEMRSYLEHFLFDAHKQRQRVGSLSGGERARVALARILKSGANLLLLDEPTNDLDVATLGALEELLETWPGAAIVVSHDRWFLDRVATSILAMEGDGRATLYPGNYSMYRDLRAESLRRTKSAPAPRAAPAPALAVRQGGEPPREVRPLSYTERKELDGILETIAHAEGVVSALEQRLADPTFYSSRAAEAGAVRAELERAQGDVAKLMARWEDLESRRDVKRPH